MFIFHFQFVTFATTSCVSAETRGVQGYMSALSCSRAGNRMILIYPPQKQQQQKTTSLHGGGGTIIKNKDELSEEPSIPFQ